MIDYIFLLMFVYFIYNIRPIWNSELRKDASRRIALGTSILGLYTRPIIMCLALAGVRRS